MNTENKLEILMKIEKELECVFEAGIAAFRAQMRASG